MILKLVFGESFCVCSGCVFCFFRVSFIRFAASAFPLRLILSQKDAISFFDHFLSTCSTKNCCLEFNKVFMLCFFTFLLQCVWYSIPRFEPVTLRYGLSLDVCRAFFLIVFNNVKAWFTADCFEQVWLCFSFLFTS